MVVAPVEARVRSGPPEAEIIVTAPAVKDLRLITFTHRHVAYKVPSSCS